MTFFSWLTAALEAYKIGKSILKKIDNYNNEQFYAAMAKLRKDLRSAKTTDDRKRILDRL